MEKYQATVFNEQIAQHGIKSHVSRNVMCSVVSIEGASLSQRLLCAMPPMEAIDYFFVG